MRSSSFEIRNTPTTSRRSTAMGWRRAMVSITEGFIRGLNALTSEAVDRSVPFLGICFGAQVLVLEKLRIRASQPSRDVSECGLVEPSFVGCGRVLSRLRAPAQDGIELDIRWLSQRLCEVDKTGDASLVDDHVGSM